MAEHKLYSPMFNVQGVNVNDFSKTYSIVFLTGHELFMIINQNKFCGA